MSFDDLKYLKNTSKLTCYAKIFFSSIYLFVATMTDQESFKQSFTSPLFFLLSFVQKENVPLIASVHYLYNIYTSFDIGGWASRQALRQCGGSTELC